LERWGLSGSIFVVLAVVMAGAPAYAQPATAFTQADDRGRLASEHFRRGRDAFLRNDFHGAGRAFDDAFAAAPHHDSLWNAAQSWESAGELARAANRYAAYLRVAPPGAPDRFGATAALAALARKLGRIHVYASTADQPHVDGEALTGEFVYVYPGTHVVTIQRGTGTIDREVSVAAQEDKSISFAGSNDTPPAPPPHAAAREPLGAATSPERSADHPGGLPPWTVLLGGGLTLAGAGAATFFGLRSLDAKNEFDRRPSIDLLESGRNDQTLTNVALGVTIGLAVVTACVAVLFVDWPTSRAAAAAPRGR
jgi:hypothetical protein